MYKNKPEMAKQWEKETPKSNLPEKSTNKRRKKKQARRSGKSD